MTPARCWPTARGARLRLYRVPLVTVGFVAEGETQLAAETDGRVFNYEVKICDDDGQDVAGTPMGRSGYGARHDAGLPRCDKTAAFSRTVF